MLGEFGCWGQGAGFGGKGFGGWGLIYGDISMAIRNNGTMPVPVAVDVAICQHSPASKKEQTYLGARVVEVVFE